MSEPVEAFAKHWSGALLAARPVDQLDRELIRATDEETMAVADYQREHVRVYPDFLSAEECAFIIEYAEANGLFERSLVEYIDSETLASDTRTSDSAFLKDRDEPVFAAIYRRVAERLRVDVARIEHLQCVRYGAGQQFKPHFDSGTTNHRLHTLLVYLNDDFAGGETYFPELDLKVQPKRGSALYFLNRDAQDSVLLCSAHAGLPVFEGLTYACNIWVRNRPVD